jgi:hypothetical protein
LTVGSAVGGLSTPGVGVYSYDYGQTVSVIAVASEGYRFVNWIMDGVNATAGSTISVQMMVNHVVVPVYVAVPVVLVATETTSNTTYSIAISGGNMTAGQMTNMTITPYASNTTTVVALNVTGPSGTTGTGTLALPKESIPYGTIPQVYIDGVLAENQTYTENADYYYVTFTTHFSEHVISIVFASPSQPMPTATPTPIPTATPTPTVTPTINPTATLSPTTAPTATPTSIPQTTATPTPTAALIPTATPITSTEAAFTNYVVLIAAVAFVLFVVFVLVFRRKKKSDA